MSNSQYRSLLLPLLLMGFLFIPWLGELLFYSKGEPREAIVAVSMLDSGNWILPVSFGQDIPYKPPFLAWLIAIASLIFNGGEVSEFTARFPSALAGVILLVATWRILVKRCGQDRAWVCMLLLATSFEFFRACLACRVDMVLTMCMVGAIYAIYTMKGRPRRVLWAVLLLSAATLTKGPVGTLLPCLAMGIYFLLRGQNFFSVFFRLTAVALASFVIPALWYYAAYLQGGDSFAALAWEENIGRLTGSMGYESHINPWYYNFITVIAGMLPWTVPVVVAFCLRKVRHSLREAISTLNRKVDSFSILAWVAFLTIFVFYCIPESKRSVYLLPCYPFICYGAAYVLSRPGCRQLLLVWSRVLAVISIVAPIALIVLSFVGLKGLPMWSPKWYQWLPAILPVLVGAWWLFTRRAGANGMFGSLLLTYVLLIGYSAAYAPMIMNPKSDKNIVADIEAQIPESETITTYIEQDSLLRYYTINFYMHDRLRLVEENTSDTWLLTDTPTGEDTTRVRLLSKKSADTRRPIYLQAPRK